MSLYMHDGHFSGHFATRTNLWVKLTLIVHSHLPLIGAPGGISPCQAISIDHGPNTSHL